MTTQDTHPIAGMTDEALQALLRHATRVTLILGLVGSLVLLVASGWRNAAMFATGGAISAASILEWQRLILLFNARLDQKKSPKAAATIVGFFVIRLILFAAAIYGSLKCFQGSAIALLCGLGLAVVAMAWEALRLLKD
jgi:hypothetical protein